MAWLRERYYLSSGVIRLLEPILRLALARTERESVDGVAIVNGKGKSSAEGFLRATREALSLIKSWDARRYHRVCQNLDYIVNVRMAPAGTYIHGLKLCLVDYEKHFATHDSEWNLRMYACTLIHEATHGLIERRSIPYYPENQERIERLCHLEEYGFIMRLDPVWADRYIGAFDAKRWKPYWGENSRDLATVIFRRFWDGLKACFKRIK